MIRRCIALAMICLCGEVVASDIDVDVELFLAVDVSRSMAPSELEIQRRGYATALASDDVIDAITGGFLGRVAITYVEWAANYSQRTIVGWRLIENRQDAKEFAAALTLNIDTSMRRTSISGAIDFAANSFPSNGFRGSRQVIDISGDGPNNQGRPVLWARQAALDQGIIINGLPLMTTDGLGGRFNLDYLDLYYQECVIGGPGSFVLPVTDWAQFPAAVRRKLILELAQPAPDSMPSQPRPAAQSDIDCLIGEKIWEQRRRDWDSL